MEKFDGEKQKAFDPAEEETRHARLDAKPVHLSKTRKAVSGGPYKPRRAGEPSDEAASALRKEAQGYEDELIEGIDAGREKRNSDM